MPTLLTRLTLDRTTPLPIYQQIYEGFRRRILTGEWAPGKPLPPERQLSAQLRVDRITLRQALDRLAKENLVRRQRGVGTFVEDPAKRQTAVKAFQVGVLTWQLEQQWATGCCAYLRDVFGMLSTALVSMGMGIVTPNLSGGPDELRQAIAAQKLHGIIALPCSGRKHLELLASIELPKILLEVRTRQPGLDNVLIDSQPGVYAGMQELLRLGHRRILYAGALVLDRDRGEAGRKQFRMAGDSLDRLRAYRMALDDAGVPFDSRDFVELDYAQEAAHALIARLKTEQRLPTAFLVFEDELAMNLWRALEAHGLQVPRDVSLLGFGNSVPEAHAGKLATSVVDYPQMVQIAVRRMYERMALGGIAGQDLLVESRFKLGASIAAPRTE
ncbi:MAG: GntR family transcriptional regulator [Planctomycetes bacterium]|nr:GntR family transcriptional regulator [Planctomycetota bacterium]